MYRSKSYCRWLDVCHRQQLQHVLEGFILREVWSSRHLVMQRYRQSILAGHVPEKPGDSMAMLGNMAWHFQTAQHGTVKQLSMAFSNSSAHQDTMICAFLPTHDLQISTQQRRVVQTCVAHRVMTDLLVVQLHHWHGLIAAPAAHCSTDQHSNGEQQGNKDVSAVLAVLSALLPVGPFTLNLHA